MGNKINMLGKKFKKLTVIDEAKTDYHREALWQCVCDCGRSAVYKGSQLRRGKALTCGRCAFGYYFFDEKIAVCRIPNNVNFTIDKTDYPLVSAFPWRVSSSGYIQSFIDGKETYLHYLLMPRKKGLLCDHINRDKMDNRRVNLRYATSSENHYNKGIQSNNTSGYIGVSLTPNARKYRSYLNYQGHRKLLGIYETAEEAAFARDKAAIKYHREFAVLNFPEIVGVADG